MFDELLPGAELVFGDVYFFLSFFGEAAFVTKLGWLNFCSGDVALGALEVFGFVEVVVEVGVGVVAGGVF